MKKIISPKIKLPFRHVRAINDIKVTQFIENELKKIKNLNDIFYDNDLSKNFLNSYLNWILNSKYIDYNMKSLSVMLIAKYIPL